jgi:transcription elongation factor Elf1
VRAFPQQDPAPKPQFTTTKAWTDVEWETPRGDILTHWSPRVREAIQFWRDKFKTAMFCCASCGSQYGSTPLRVTPKMGHSHCHICGRAVTSYPVRSFGLFSKVYRQLDLFESCCDLDAKHERDSQVKVTTEDKAMETFLSTCNKLGIDQ